MSFARVLELKLGCPILCAAVRLTQLDPCHRMQPQRTWNDDLQM